MKICEDAFTKSVGKYSKELGFVKQVFDFANDGTSLESILYKFDLIEIVKTWYRKKGAG